MSIKKTTRASFNRQTALLPGLILLAGATGAPVIARAANDVSARLPDPGAQTQRSASEEDKYDPYRLKGWNITFPGPKDTVDPEAGGLRSALADKGIGYTGLIFSYNAYDVLNRGHYDRGRGQVYNGQKMTDTDKAYLWTTYDLSQHGIENGQLQVGISSAWASWAPNGPTPQIAAITTLAYYQTLFDGKVELQFGYLANTFNFLGTYVGGNLAAGSLGISGALTYETGLSASAVSRPTFNAKINFGNGFYNRFGIQRSISPDGASDENDENPAQLGFDGPHTGWLFIDEIGVRHKASADNRELWLRGGYLTNTSDYIDYRNPGTRDDGNYLAYFLADRQIYQPTPEAGSSYRGIYVGGSVEYGPPAYNTISENYELRLYSKGMIPGQPHGQVSIVAGRKVYSNDLIANARQAGSPTNDSTNSLTVSYTTPVIRGLYVSGGLQYLDNPQGAVTSSGQGNGLNALLNLNMWF